MDNVYLDVKRLGLIHDMPIALESMSVANHLKDFVHYYFTRFITNVTHSFKDFTTSEIADFNHRHTSAMAMLLKRPSPKLAGVIVPIPKGMIQPYDKTIKALLGVLGEVSPKDIRQDLTKLTDALDVGSTKGLTSGLYTKDQFDRAKLTIGKLFGKVGLTHATAEHVMVDKDAIEYTNTKLIDITGYHYPDLIVINELVKTLESKYEVFKGTEHDKHVLSQQFMTMAYRLSIMAIVMDHIQLLEHAFVGSLKIVLSKQD